jgi:hypothetical protein
LFRFTSHPGYCGWIGGGKGLAMARKQSGNGLLGWIGVLVLVLIVLAYLQHHGMIHLPVKLP